MAPPALTAYSSPTRGPRSPRVTSDDRTTSGSVAPINAVGTSSTAAEQARRARVRTAKLSATSTATAA